MRKRALRHISSLHPTTLDEWEQLEDKTSPWLDELLDDNEHDAVSILSIVLLARPLSIEWILPIAFYRICRYTEEETLLKGVGPEGLNWEDKIRCVTACRVLESTEVTKVLDFLWDPLTIDGCNDAQGCLISRMAARRVAEGWRLRNSDQMAIMPLEVWRPKAWGELEGTTVCAACLSGMKSAHQEAKQALWDRLPAMFGLLEWTELEKMKAEALK